MNDFKIPSANKIINNDEKEIELNFNIESFYEDSKLIGFKFTINKKSLYYLLKSNEGYHFYNNNKIGIKNIDRFFECYQSERTIININKEIFEIAKNKADENIFKLNFLLEIISKDFILIKKLKKFSSVLYKLVEIFDDDKIIDYFENLSFTNIYFYKNFKALTDVFINKNNNKYSLNNIKSFKPINDFLEEFRKFILVNFNSDFFNKLYIDNNHIYYELNKEIIMDLFESYFNFKLTQFFSSFNNIMNNDIIILLLKNIIKIDLANILNINKNIIFKFFEIPEYFKKFINSKDEAVNLFLFIKICFISKIPEIISRSSTIKTILNLEKIFNKKFKEDYIEYLFEESFPLDLNIPDCYTFSMTYMIKIDYELLERLTYKFIMEKILREDDCKEINRLINDVFIFNKNYINDNTNNILNVNHELHKKILALSLTDKNYPMNFYQININDNIFNNDSKFIFRYEKNLSYYLEKTFGNIKYNYLFNEYPNIFNNIFIGVFDKNDKDKLYYLININLRSLIKINIASILNTMFNAKIEDKSIEVPDFSVYKVDSYNNLVVCLSGYNGIEYELSNNKVYNNRESYYTRKYTLYKDIVPIILNIFNLYYSWNLISEKDFLSFKEISDEKINKFIYNNKDYKPCKNESINKIYLED